MAAGTQNEEQCGQRPHSVVVKTPRLILRNFLSSDAANMYHLRASAENRKYIQIGAPVSIEDTQNWINERHRDPVSFNFVVLLREDESKAIGSVGGIRTPEFGYMIDSPYWGKGIATEAVRAAIDAYWLIYPDGMPFLEEEQRCYIQCMTDKANTGSVAVLRKLGFHKVGVKHEFKGEKVDLEIWQVDKDEWKASMKTRPQVDISSDADIRSR